MKRTTLLQFCTCATLFAVGQILPIGWAAPGAATKAATLVRPTQPPMAATSRVSEALLHKFVIAVEKVALINYDGRAKTMMNPQQKAALLRVLQKQESQAKSAVTWISATKATIGIAERLREYKYKIDTVRVETFLSPAQRAALARWYQRKIKSTVGHIMSYSQYRELRDKLDTDPKFRHQFHTAYMDLVLSQGPQLPWFQQVKDLRKVPPGCLRFSDKKIIPIRGTLVIEITYGPPYVTDQGTPHPSLFLKLIPPLNVCHIANPNVALTAPTATIGDFSGERQQYKVTSVTYYNISIPGLFVLGNWLGYNYHRWRTEAVEKLIDPYLGGRIQIWARIFGETNNPGGWAVDSVLKVCLMQHDKLVKCRGHLPDSAPTVGTVEPRTLASVPRHK